MTHTITRRRRARYARELAHRQRPAVCPTCGHGRGRHRVLTASGDDLLGAQGGPCLAREGCNCPAYTGPWPVHHFHVTDRPCTFCGVAGSHWAVTDGRKVVRVALIADMPGEVDR